MYLFSNKQIGFLEKEKLTMKNAKAPMTDEQAKSRGFRRIEWDHMPSTVATDMLCSLERISNRERKELHRARWQVFQAIQEPKPVEVKAANRCKRATWLQLNTWLPRVIQKRWTLQRSWDKLQAALASQPPGGAIAMIMRMLASLDVAAKSMDTFRDSLEDEIKRRTEVCTNLPFKL